MSSHPRPTLPTGADATHLVRGQKPLDVAAVAFGLLTAGPQPLSIDGRTLGYGLPRRPIVLHELAAVLMHPSCDFQASDAVWRLLVEHARSLGPAWVVGAVGVALPGLRSAAWRLGKVFTGDVQAELVAGFVVALTGIDAAEPKVAQRLCSTALVTARARLRAVEPARNDITVHTPTSVPPPAPGGHPDFVLARAVRDKVITAAGAELIGATRLEDVPIAVYAEHIGVSRWAVYKARARAEERLTAAITAGSLTDETATVIGEATNAVMYDPAEGL